MFEIGKVLKRVGFKGEMIIETKSVLLDRLQPGVPLFIGSHRNHIPYFIETIKPGNPTILKLEDINNPEEVVTLHNKSIFVQDASMLEIEHVEDNFNVLVGCIAHDENDEPIGEILRIEEFPQQIMAFIKHNKKEIMIPLNETYILQINVKETYIQLKLPDGILDL